MPFESSHPFPVIHQVYFKLGDRSEETRKAFVDYCYEYLSDHAGMTHFSLGLRAVEMQRTVNDQDFDIVMNMVFENLLAYEKYRQNPRHERWITLAGSMSTERRVFDSYLIPKPTGAN